MRNDFEELALTLQALADRRPNTLPTERHAAQDLLYLGAWASHCAAAGADGYDGLQVAARMEAIAERIRSANRRRVSIRSDAARWAGDIEQAAHGLT